MFVNAVQTWRKCVLDEIDALWLSRPAQAQALSHTPRRKAVSFILSFQLFLFCVKQTSSCLKIVDNLIWKWRRRWRNLTTGGRNVSAAQVLDLAQLSSAPLTFFFPPLPSWSLLSLWWMRRYFSCSSEYERSGFDYNARWSQNQKRRPAGGILHNVRENVTKRCHRHLH